jgi:5-methylcytosine-specific restriction endonuclease McrA
MCRGQPVCTVLGDRPEAWSSRAPLPVPSWFNTQLDAFSLAVQEAAHGDRRQAVELLAAVGSADLRTWYVEHGQVSGRFRVRVRRPMVFSLVSLLERDAQRSPDGFAKEIFRRDGFLCRYCGLRVIPKQVFAAFARAVGVEAFRATGTNDERHGVVLAFRANVDHVLPWKLGGATAPENLVTACWSCNYGKAGYAIEQRGQSYWRELLGSKRAIGVRSCFLLSSE